MSEPTTKQFNELLSDLAKNETFNVRLTDNKEYTFKQLTTNQLKELVKTVVDSPLTQSVFNTTLGRIMSESAEDKSISVGTFNVVDRLLFCLSTRIESLSPSLKLTQENGTEHNIDLVAVRDKIYESLKANSNLLVTQKETTSQAELTFGVPTIKVENQLNEELYKNVDLNIETPNDLRKALGEAFINEIAKTIQTIAIQEQTLDLSAGTFKARLKVVESLPASLVQKVIEFVENYKKAIETPLKITEELSVSIDGSLFSLR